MVKNIILLSVLCAFYGCISSDSNINTPILHFDGYVDPVLGANIVCYKVLNPKGAYSDDQFLPYLDLEITLRIDTLSRELTLQTDGHFVLDSVPLLSLSEYFIDVKYDGDTYNIPLGLVPAQPPTVLVLDTAILQNESSGIDVELLVEVSHETSAVLVGDRFTRQRVLTPGSTSSRFIYPLALGEYSSSLAFDCRVLRNIASNSCFDRYSSLPATLAWTTSDTRDTLVGAVSAVAATYVEYEDAITNNVNNWNSFSLEFIYPEPRVLSSNLSNFSGFIRLQRSTKVYYSR